MSLIAGAKRRRRIAEYNASVRRNNSNNARVDVVQVHYQQPNQPVTGQPVQQAQPQTQYPMGQPAGYGQPIYQDPSMGY